VTSPPPLSTTANAAVVRRGKRRVDEQRRPPQTGHCAPGRVTHTHTHTHTHTTQSMIIAQSGNPASSCQAVSCHVITAQRGRAQREPELNAGTWFPYNALNISLFLQNHGYPCRPPIPVRATCPSQRYRISAGLVPHELLLPATGNMPSLPRHPLSPHPRIAHLATQGDRVAGSRLSSLSPLPRIGRYPAA
jgi:hypothetical protein